MSLEIIAFKFIKNEDINNLFEKSSSICFNHTLEWLNYSLSMRNSGSENFSFGVLENNKLIAFVPLIKEYIYENPSKNEFSMAGFPSVYPVFSDDISKNNRDKIEKIIFKEIFKITELENIEYINFYVNPLIDELLNKEIMVNPLSKFGFHDVSISTNILELKKDESLLFKNFRKGTKSDIKTAIKNGYEIEIYNKDTITEDIFDNYQQIHFIAAGRKTRPDKTWDIMRNWIFNDLSILVLTKIDDKYISAQLVNTYLKKAYYQSGATLPEYQRETGIGHLAQWEIIKYLNKMNFTNYELGWNWYSNISMEVADNKMLGISRFKSGFGAKIYPLFRGEWFKDKEYLKEIYNKRINSYE